MHIIDNYPPYTPHSTLQHLWKLYQHVNSVILLFDQWEFRTLDLGGRAQVSRKG
jgi:2'-5' RNA ligase